MGYRDAIVLTVFNRPELMLQNVFEGLRKNNLSDTLVIVVDDGSTMNYDIVKRGLKGIDHEWVRVDTVKDRPGTYAIKHHTGCYNNPAYAFNTGLQVAVDKKCEHLFVLSSDVILPPTGLDIARTHGLEDNIFCGSVTDQDSARLYVCSRLLWPMPWFIGTHLGHVAAIGGWDEEFLKGIAFEDNDFMARLFLQVGSILISEESMAWHQSHSDTAYSDNLKGWGINQKYILQKFGGTQAPFNKNGDPLEYDTRSTSPAFTYMLNPRLLKLEKAS